MKFHGSFLVYGPCGAGFFLDDENKKNEVANGTKSVLEINNYKIITKGAQKELDVYHTSHGTRHTANQKKLKTKK